MPHNIIISDELFSRLQARAVPLIDTIESVIARLLDSDTGHKTNSTPEGYRLFDPASPPNLGHTSVLSATVGGQLLKSSETFWNNIIVAMIKVLAARGMSAKDIDATLASNSAVGQKAGNGYKFIKEAGISIQGLDANNAWRTIFLLSTVANIPVDVKFKWQNKDGVEMPGVIGAFIVQPVMSKAA
ncbi:hypothetical protein ELI00_19565 [Rhizobium ruizarguesonis]|uniref:T4SS efffector SepA family protein n=1 Tax=Rhizobium ruizarguesonis TaxID=2081791 RepID=UPI001030F072|nr:hypothetical protein [Rhizobium ruizarguesonis]TAU50002.1 hypothetical protein ELI42_19120 [Rhizobium ruizarguesonis]TAU65073.1 hypothetical protein ELI44_19140 [Rhizobium ruizarguesonis]TAX78269.1 hypothetical protein ELI00_19565 [Rhizobium ruizarguesonis]